MVIDAEKYVDTALETLAMEKRDIQLMQARTIFQKTQEQI